MHLSGQYAPTWKSMDYFYLFIYLFYINGLFTPLNRTLYFVWSCVLGWRQTLNLGPYVQLLLPRMRMFLDLGLYSVSVAATKSAPSGLTDQICQSRKCDQVALNFYIALSDWIYPQVQHLRSGRVHARWWCHCPLPGPNGMCLILLNGGSRGGIERSQGMIW